jgi:predicted transcriptional regulator
LINNFGLNQKETAKKLGVTPAAICQYISKKRGKIKIIDEKIINEINDSAKIIINNGVNSVVSETCRICKIMRSQGIFSTFQCNVCEETE